MTVYMCPETADRPATVAGQLGKIAEERREGQGGVVHLQRVPLRVRPARAGEVLPDMRVPCGGWGMTGAGWEYRFPPIADPPGLSQQLLHVLGEAEEAREAHREAGWRERVAEELMDVVHAAETALRMLEKDGADLDGVRRGVIAKNEERGYYG